MLTDLDFPDGFFCLMAGLQSPVMMAKMAAKTIFAGERGCHDWDHTLRVSRLCKSIGEMEGAEMDSLMIAAYFHDIGRSDQDVSLGKVCHAVRGAEMARTLIKEIPISPQKKENVIHCIRAHRFRDDLCPATLEAKVLYDADKLDALGAIGIARAYMFAGQIGSRLHNPENRISYTKAYSEDDTGYREFIVKLSRIKDKMMTSQGKKMAMVRHDFMKSFFQRLLEENDGNS